MMGAGSSPQPLSLPCRSSGETRGAPGRGAAVSGGTVLGGIPAWALATGAGFYMTKQFFFAAGFGENMQNELLGEGKKEYRASF